MRADATSTDDGQSIYVFGREMIAYQLARVCATRTLAPSPECGRFTSPGVPLGLVVYGYNRCMITVCEKKKKVYHVYYWQP